MPAYVTLHNRLPEIMALGLPQRTAALTLATAEAVAEGAKTRVPVDTGRLRDSIEARPRSTGKGIVQAAAVVALFYWFFQEFGTRYQAAQPFMIPAAEEARVAINRLAHEIFLEL